MKFYFSLALLIFFSACLFGQGSSLTKSMELQKPALDTGIFAGNMWGKWKRARGAKISNNGRYVFYEIFNQPMGGTITVFRPISEEWEMKFQDAKMPVITDDSKQAIFINQHDSLCSITLDNASLKFIADAQSFENWNAAGKERIVYRMKTQSNGLVLQDINTSHCQYYEDVAEYWLHPKRDVIVLKKEETKDGTKLQTLYWVNVSNGDSSFIWKGDAISDIVLDDNGTQLVFRGESKKEESFWYYETGTDQAMMLTIPETKGIDSSLKVQSIQRFSKSGRRLFVTLQEKNSSIAPNPDTVKSDVWSYLDVKLQSEQLYDISSNGGQPHTYTGVVDISSHTVLRLNKENEEIQIFDKDDWAIITKTKGGNKFEWNWNNNSIPSFYLISTLSGERKLLPINYPDMSRGGRYLIGTDSYIPNKVNNLLSYDVETGQVHNLTRSLSIPIDDREVFSFESLKHRGLMVGGWLANDQALLVYDQFDIWQLDPLGKKAPLNLTNGYGRRNQIIFRLTTFATGDDPIISETEPLLLNAFNKTTKKSGLYSIVPKNRVNPQEVFPMAAIKIGQPKKARDTGIYIFTREAAAQSPNWFFTSDFKRIHPITNVYPEKGYNWLTSELITWKTFDGSMSSGILFKPENFNPNRKYPVIINYYEELSDKLNRYLSPGTTTDNINIPWFVSNGYLVFVPDIHYKIGHTGQSAYNSVVSAAKYLAQFRWVDEKHMGLQGHSFGGYETNYIVTNTNLFAAAMSSSGFSDLISIYGSTFDSEIATFWKKWAETGQGRICRTLWQQPDLYVRNSPLFKADKVTTPLLMMNNKNDGIVPFQQGIEFFTALRRLGKRVWMLQYDKQDHGLYPGSKEALLHTIRLTQFFDHYLKGKPAPKWMTRGIPASKKAIDYGLEPDNEIATPGKGLLK
jgi:dipeptidyl aminopeptidase/acylaminoacyl peptidase